jgi:hypothetical protein
MRQQPLPMPLAALAKAYRARKLTAEGYDRNNQAEHRGLSTSANFGQAQSAALADMWRQQQSRRHVQRGQRQNAGTFNAGQDFNAQQTNASNDIAGAGLRLNASGQAGNLASLLASMSDQELHQALTRAGIIEGVGAEQTGQQQSINDAAYEEFMRQLQYPYQTQNLTNAALGLTQSRPPPRTRPRPRAMFSAASSARLLAGPRLGLSSMAEAVDARHFRHIQFAVHAGNWRRRQGGGIGWAISTCWSLRSRTHGTLSPWLHLASGCERSLSWQQGRLSRRQLAGPQFQRAQRCARR